MMMDCGKCKSNLWKGWRWICTYPFCQLHRSNDDPTSSLSTRNNDSVIVERLPQVFHQEVPTYETLSLHAINSFGRDAGADRSSLIYADSLGKGWFGWVIQGTYKGKRVAVQVLREEASVSEQKGFIEQALILSRSSGHENVLNLVGVILDRPPFLAILELTLGPDLKTFLINARAADQLAPCVDGRLLLKFSRDIANGLDYLHQANQTPLDLAARCCQLTDDLTVKIGDYGLARTTYPADYLSSDPRTTSNHSLQEQTSQLNGRELMKFLPLRWLAPEVRERILRGRNNGYDDNDGSAPPSISKAENIWSLGITLWEVGTFAAQQPFQAISDHQFLRAGLINPGPTLDAIKLKGVEGEAIMSVINMCMKKDPSQRLSCDRLSRYLNDVYECSTSFTEFLPNESQDFFT